MTSTGADAETIGEIVATLRQDPVLVQQLLGNGHTAEVRDELAGLAGKVGHPVYVALVQRPDGLRSDRPEDELLRLIHLRLDEPGLYVVGTQDGILAVEAYDVPLDSVSVRLGSYDARDVAMDRLPDQEYVGKAGETALTLAVAADDDHELSSAQVREVTDQQGMVVSDVSEPSRYDLQVEPLTPLVVAVACAVVSLAVAWRLLRARAADDPPPRHVPGKPRGLRGPSTPTKPQEDPVLKRARVQLKRLERRLATTSTSGQPLDEAIRCRDLARELVDAKEPLGLIGAWVLSCTGLALLGKGSGTFHPCFFNPLHGEARAGVRAASVGQVPACATCARTIGRGERPDVLLIQGGLRDRPYYEGSSVWAETGFGSLVDDLWVRVERDRR